MKQFSLLLLSALLSSIAIELKGQDFNDEMKRKLRQSITLPKIEAQNAPTMTNPIRLKKDSEEILRVSPFTKLPTRGDRLVVLHPYEELKVHTTFHPTNFTPLNELPVGSVNYEFVGRSMQIVPTAGTRVVPSGMGAGPIRKRHKRGKNLLKAFQK